MVLCRTQNILSGPISCPGLPRSAGRCMSIASWGDSGYRNCSLISNKKICTRACIPLNGL